MKTTQKVCVVDDNLDYTTMVKLLLNKYLPHYEVTTFADGKEFLDQLPSLSVPPSLIILDRHMPGLDGHQTLVHLKHHPTYRRTPVVMMSADATQSEINDCYESGVNSFLLKSINPDGMKEMLIRTCTYWLELNQAPAYL